LKWLALLLGFPCGQTRNFDSVGLITDSSGTMWKDEDGEAEHKK